MVGHVRLRRYGKPPNLYVVPLPVTFSRSLMRDDDTVPAFDIEVVEDGILLRFTGYEIPNGPVKQTMGTPDWAKDDQS